MRTRLLVVLLAFSATAVAAFAWPLLMVTASERTQQLLISRNADLDRFAVLAQQAETTGDSGQLVAEVLRYSSLYGEPVVVANAARKAVVESGGMHLDDPAVTNLIDGALRNEPAPPVPTVQPWSTEDVLLARPVGTGTRVAGAVVLRASVRAAAEDVAKGWSTIVAGALTAAAGCVLLVLALSRWVLRPMAELARGMRAMTEGERWAHVTGKAGPREMRSLAEQFNRMSDAVSEAAEQQRRLISDASHQLRNPMAALRLRVDSLAPRVDEQGQRSYRSAVAEVERLESLLDGLLAMASAESTATRLAADGDSESCLADEVVEAGVYAWTPAAEQAGVELVTAEITADLAVQCSESDLGQVLDVAVDNAIKYSGRGARIEVSCVDIDGSVRITVSDNGPGLPAEELAMATERFWRSTSTAGARGTGLGLPIAQALVTARGGTLRLENRQPQGFAVVVELPEARE
ncbi:HAMP domain-containing sensor histidine kinase [Kutzneria viridogrisea]|uniref:histidine kinase n=1 Tax=Kutzneria viridogrisea TaxID=47990 RepID=A0ABR6BP95_9PSEU|nr:signal transduction histidine kinase [Kutzneria viridogrisea]